jgi:hypothetical protein
MLLYRLLIMTLASLTLSGCISYSDGDGYYYSPGYHDDDYSHNDGYYGNPSQYGTFSYAPQGYRNNRFSWISGTGYPYFLSYPSIGWGYLSYYHHDAHQVHAPQPYPIPSITYPRHANRPGFHPDYPIADRPDTTLLQSPVYTQGRELLQRPTSRPDAGRRAQSIHRERIELKPRAPNIMHEREGDKP